MRTQCTVAVILSLGSPAPAQIGGSGSAGALAPSQNLTLDTAANGGVFEYTMIAIPAGVTVTVLGPNPAILLSQGPVTIAGRLVADGQAAVGSVGGAGGPGGFRGGDGGLGSCGQAGTGPGGGGAGCVQPFSQPGAGGPAGHATRGVPFGSSGAGGPAYGAAYPFDLRGGSGDGGGANPFSYGQPAAGGGGGGGVVVVLADAPISVSGTVSVAAPHGGSAGSVLLRSMVSVSVSGTIDALGLKPLGGLGVTRGDGYVRLDAYGQPPVVTGAIRAPAPALLQLPELTGTAAPKIGTTWALTSAAAPGDLIALFLSAAPAAIPLPPFGTLGLDPAAGIVLAASAGVPAVGVDPLAAFAVPIPAVPQLAGMQVFAQAFDAGGATGRPLLSNTIRATVGP